MRDRKSLLSLFIITIHFAACGKNIDLGGDPHNAAGGTAGSGGAAGGTGGSIGTGGAAGGTAGSIGTGGAAAGTGGSIGTGGAAGGSGAGPYLDASRPPPDSNLPIDDAGKPPPLACGGPAGSPLEDSMPPSETSRFFLNFVGSWLRCSAVSWLGTTDDVGIEFTSDGKWYLLYATPAGSIARGSGFDQEGTWGYYAEQMYVEIFGGGGTTLFPALTTSPRRMRLNNFGVFVADYIDAALADGGVTPVMRPDSGTDVPAACSEGGTPLAVDGTTFLATFSGSWLLCGKPSFFGSSDEVGLEITSDGQWFKLYRGVMGDLERGAGFDEQGTWDMLGRDGGVGQTNFNVFGGGYIPTFLAFTSSPRKMRITGDGPGGTYVRVDESAVPPEGGLGVNPE